MFELSERHGVNPTFILCAWCLRPKKFELMGRLPGDIIARQRASRIINPAAAAKSYGIRELL